MSFLKHIEKGMKIPQREINESGFDFQTQEEPDFEDGEDSGIEHASTNNEYFNILDPDTGRRYMIPMLDVAAPGYFFKYINFMKILQSSPRTFKSIMEWA